MIGFRPAPDIYMYDIDTRELQKELRSNQYTVVTTCGWYFYTNKIKFLIKDAGGGCYKTSATEFQKLLEDGQAYERLYKEQMFKKKFEELIND